MSGSDAHGPDLRVYFLIVRVKLKAREAFLERAKSLGMTQSKAMREALADWMKKTSQSGV